MRRFTSGLRFSASVLLFGLSLLAVFRAPTSLLWKFSILVTEWAHWIALASLLVFLPGWRRSKLDYVAVILGVLAAVLAMTPILRATSVARALPARLVKAFGTEASFETAAHSPLVASALLRGVDLPPVRVRSVVYAKPESQSLQLDLYEPTPSRKLVPGVMVIHGGSWRSGDSKEFAELSLYLAGRGYLVASINYRLTPEWPFPAARDDVLAAIDYLKTNADTLGLDPQKIVLLGRSAGGELALLVAYTARDPSIRGVVSFYAPADMHFSYAHPGNPLVIDTHNILQLYLSGNPQQAKEKYDAASPIQFVSPEAPPTLLIHGNRDELVNFRHSERLAVQLANAGVPHLLLALPWATHACDYNFSGPSGQISTYAIERFLAAVR